MKKYYTEEDILKEYGSLVNADWEYLSQHVNLPEHIIIQYQYDVHWPFICIYQTMSEDLIERCTDHVYWRQICLNQKLSPKFIANHYKHILLIDISNNDHTSNFIKQMIELYAIDRLTDKQLIRILKSDYAQIMDKL